MNIGGVCFGDRPPRRCVWVDLVMARPRGQKPSQVLVLVRCGNYFVSENINEVKFG